MEEAVCGLVGLRFLDPSRGVNGDAGTLLDEARTAAAVCATGRRNKFLLAIPLIFQFYKTASNFVCFCRSMNSTNPRTGAKKSHFAAVAEDRGKKS